MMPPVLIISLLLLMAAMLLGMFRLARGPTLYDRIMAFDAVAVCAAGVIVLLSHAWGTTVYLELILIVSSLGFFTTVAFAFYLQRAKAEDDAGDDRAEPADGKEDAGARD